MKKFILIVFALMTATLSCNTTPEQIEKTSSVFNTERPGTEIIFEDENNLPSKIIIEEDYFDNTKNIFFVLSDYRRSYSRIAEYNTQNRKIENIIYESEQDEIIYEYQCGNGVIVFSVLSRGVLFSYDIYLFDIESGSLNKINSYPLNQTESILPLSIKMDSNFIVWVEQDFINNASVVKCYDLKKKKEEAVNISAFNNNTFKIATFFTNIDKGIVIYDRPVNNNEKEIVMYDLRNRRELATVLQMEDVVLYYNGILNKDYGYLALYAQTHSEDVIYVHDLTKNTNRKIVGFYPNTVVYDDIITSKGLDILYNVQLNVSGNINEHYFGEIYHLYDYTMEKIDYSFNLYSGTKYLAFLKFDKNPRVRNIHFELFSRE
jgi:hypothetical protein